jgi:hypothetical protein
MNMRNSTKFLLPAVLLGSVVAVAEEWHPSGFQPAPVFEDEGLVGRAAFPHKPPAKPAAAVPAASPPKPVAEKNPAAPPAARLSAGHEETVAPGEAKGHPSGFEPPPVFEDEGLTRRAMPSRTPPAAPKAAEPPAVAFAAPASPSPVAARPEAGTPRAEPAPAAVDVRSSGGWAELLATNYPVGLIVLLLAGYVFRSTRRAGGMVRSGSPTPPALPANSGKTGVARYLEGVDVETGVAKYLRGIGG